MTQRTVLLGVSGGVAAYKAVEVASALNQAGFATHVAMTRAARELVGPISFAAVTNRPVLTDIFVKPEGQDWEAFYPHLYPATRADACVLVPATANLIARVAHGLAGNIVTAAAVALPEPCRRYYCPAMNLHMWRQPTVQANCRRLDELGWRRLGPVDGRLACGSVGPGRMAEPKDIVAAILADFRREQELHDRRLLLLSGPTVEPIDPVRFISNQSSGRMGRALAIAACAAGAEIDFITGPVAPDMLPRNPRIHVTQVQTAAEMLSVAETHFDDADAAVFVAAVADYAPVETMREKRPKDETGIILRLRPTADIAAALSARKRPDQVCIGFALETHDAPVKARAKLTAKHLDAIVLNDTSSFAAAAGRFQYLAADAPAFDDWGELTKDRCAARLVDRVAGLLNR